MSEKIINGQLNFIDSNGTEKAILGTLEGECADFIDSTRNGRKYSDTLWEKVFKNSIVNELIENGGIPGELDHPTDREETDSARIAILMKEKPVKRNGKLYGRFCILNTPLGKIAYTLAKAGFKLGISSRGSGETYTDIDGNESVDPDSYDFKAFDLVLLPAVKNARLNLISESLDTNRIKYKKELSEALNTANEEDRKIMVETLQNLNIDYSEKEDNIEDIDKLNQDNQAVVNNEVSLVKDLQEALKKIKVLETSARVLQEKLSVSYTEGTKWEEERAKYKGAIKNLTESNQKLIADNKVLKSNIASMDKDSDRVKELESLIESLTERLSRQNRSANVLQESITNKDKQINSYKAKSRKYDEQISSLKENYESSISDLENEISRLNEGMIALKKDSRNELSNVRTKLEERLNNSNKLVEKYKNIAKTAVNRYISLQAVKIGVNPTEIKNRLDESYSFDDIDRVCEDLQSYKVNISKLPFNIDSNRQTRVQMKESKESILPTSRFDDDVDAQLLALAGKSVK